MDEAALNAARARQLEVRRYLVDREPRLLRNPDLLRAAARSGNVACLEFLDEAGCLWTRTGYEAAALRAARAGQLEILEYLVDRYPRLREHPNLVHAAARSGSEACLRLLDRFGCKWQGNEPVAAACSGSSQALRHCLIRCEDSFRKEDWTVAMEIATSCGAPDCQQALWAHLRAHWPITSGTRPV
eukprot:jgi/Botrbrau1/10460/Bobra.0133s0067.1